MKILSWNVNSIRVRKNQLLYVIKKENPDIICLQETKTIEIAQKIASGPNIANYLTKKLIWESFENALEKQLQLEKSAIGICGKSADYKNAILSFANKKAPVFYGK